MEERERERERERGERRRRGEEKGVSAGEEKRNRRTPDN